MSLESGTLRTLLTGTLPEEEAHKCLELELVPAIVSQMNQELGATVSLYRDEPIPMNQRNLTDVRTRMGILLEYEFCRVGNAIVRASGVSDATLTHVVAHRFPDLAVRYSNGTLGLCFEMKAIEAIAEEKSANFHTLIKDVRPARDFLVVLLWEWKDDGTGARKIPHVVEAHVLEAFRLARMRDTYWLHSPPGNPGNGRQGLDFDNAVNCTDGRYNREEGNYGKLMRVFSATHAEYLDSATRTSRTYENYFRMRTSADSLGVARVGAQLAASFAGPDGEVRAPERTNDSVCIAARRRDGTQLVVYGPVAGNDRQDAQQAAEKLGAETLLTMNAKFDWVLFRDRGGAWTRVRSGRKPEEARAALSE